MQGSAIRNTSMEEISQKSNQQFSKNNQMTNNSQNGAAFNNGSQNVIQNNKMEILAEPGSAASIGGSSQRLFPKEKFLLK